MQLKQFVVLTMVLTLLASPGSSRAKSPDAPTAVIGEPARGADLPGAILNAYANGARDITIAPGTYRIPPTGKSVIKLCQWKDATIHAQGVTIIFEKPSNGPLQLVECDNVTLEGVTVRFAEPGFTQGRIKAIGEDALGKYLDWQIDAGYPIFSPTQKTFLDVVDQDTRLLKAGTGDFRCMSVETLGTGLLRLRKISQLGSAAVNDWLFTRLPESGNQLIHLDKCNRCTMRKITLQNCGFAPFFETFGEGGHYYVDCRISPGPKPSGATEEQLVCAGADGFHSAGVRKGPTIERCVWEGVLHDDCIAIHGGLHRIVRVEGNKLILQTRNRGFFVAGEPVRISGTNGLVGDFNCTAVRFLKDGGDLLELTLDRESGAPLEAKASNPQNVGSGLKVLDCTLGNSRSRGILVKCNNARIEGCTISGCGMSAISIGPEKFWSGADYSRNVNIRGNVLRNNNLNGRDAGVIRLHGDDIIGNGNISITGNLLDRNYGKIAISTEYTDGILIAGNRFITSSMPLLEGSRTVLAFKSAKNITLQGNVVENAAKTDTLVNLGGNVEGITGNDAKGISVATPPGAF